MCVYTISQQGEKNNTFSFCNLEPCVSDGFDHLMTAPALSLLPNTTNACPTPPLILSFSLSFFLERPFWDLNKAFYWYLRLCTISVRPSNRDWIYPLTYLPKKQDKMYKLYLTWLPELWDWCPQPRESSKLCLSSPSPCPILETFWRH